MGVVVTVGMDYEAIEDADDPDFPQLNCVNGEWGDRWVQTLRGFAQYPFMGIGVVPDEYNWNTGRLRRRFADHPDERVRQFYENLPTYCECEACRERFQREYGEPLPEMGQWSRPPAQTDAYRKFIDFRYRCTTDLIGRAADAIHSTDHDIRADSLICVSPICSDFRLGTGVAWDMIGYHTDLQYPTTDPYILLHNYLGDSTHWYVTETAAHLVGCTPRRQCGIVLEGTQLRAEHRSLLPVEIYGSALSAVARGATEVAFFHYVHLVRQTAAGQAQGESGFNAVRGCYDLLQRIDPWLEGAEPVRRVALLYSRASDEYFSFYTHPEPNTEILTHDTDDPRYPFLAQKEVLYYLFRAGVPTDLYYLDQVSAEELEGYETVVVPFPFAVSEEQAALLESLAAAGKTLIVISEFGSVDEMGVPHERPVLLDLLGLAEAPSGEKRGSLQATDPAMPAVEGEFSVYDRVVPAGETRIAAMVQETPVITARAVGDGGVVFLAGEFGIDLPANRDNEARDRTVRIMPPELSDGHVKLFDTILRRAGALEQAVAENDVEVALMRNGAGEHVLFAINWEEHPVTVSLALPDEIAGAGAGLSLSAAGSVTERSIEAGASDLRLAPQEAVVLRFAAR
ncbi:MAG: beta-galactosidase trimerization domain-containing protein, partial [Armatimonadota bacterium]